MHLNPVAQSMRWVIVQLLVVAILIAAFVLVILPSHPGELGGGFFVAVGIMNIVSYKSTGRKIFAKTQTSRPFVAKFWAHNGEFGTQVLFLGIGVILAIAGGVLMVAGPV